jgi:hypothetical protein
MIPPPDESCDRPAERTGQGSEESPASRKPLLVVAYYTMGTPYEVEVENLRRPLAVLPLEYTFIFDLCRRAHPTANPVIEHFQASRRFKNMITGRHDASHRGGSNT